MLIFHHIKYNHLNLITTSPQKRFLISVRKLSGFSSYPGIIRSTTLVVRHPLHLLHKRCYPGGRDKGGKLLREGAKQLGDKAALPPGTSSQIPTAQGVKSKSSKVPPKSEDKSVVEAFPSPIDIPEKADTSVTLPASRSEKLSPSKLENIPSLRDSPNPHVSALLGHKPVPPSQEPIVIPPEQKFDGYPQYIVDKLRATRPDLFKNFNTPPTVTSTLMSDPISSNALDSFSNLLESGNNNSSKINISTHGESSERSPTKLKKDSSKEEVLQSSVSSLLEEINKMKNIQNWTEDKNDLLKRLKLFLDTNYKIPDDFRLPPTRDEIEFEFLYSRKRILTKWELEIHDLLSKGKYNNPRVPPHCEHNIEIENKLMEVLQKHGEELYINDEPVWHELIRRAEITSNMDASATREEVLDDNNPDTMYAPYSIPISDGQGPKVVAEAYEVMNKNPKVYFQECPINFDKNEMGEILLKIMHDPIEIGILKRSDLNTPYLSGDDLHCLGVISYKEGYLAFITLTSANDDKTVKFGDKQYANKNVQEQGKAEYFRPLTFLVYISKADNIFFEASHHTNLVNKSKYGNLTVREILVSAVRYTYPVWSTNMVREPLTFTPDKITQLAISMCESRRDALKTYNSTLLRQLNWNNLSEEDKNEKIEERTKSYQNNLLSKQEAEYTKTLPENVRKICQSKKLLEKEKSHSEKSIAPPEKKSNVKQKDINKK